MKITIVTTRLPYPMDNGAKIRAFHLLKALAENHAVTLISFYGSAAEERFFDIYKSLNVKLVPIHHPAIDQRITVKDLMMSVAKGLPPTVGKYFDARMLQAVLSHCADTDVIHCEHMHMAQYLSAIRDVPKVLDAHNVESQIAERLFTTERRWVRRVLLKWNSQKMLQYEQDIARTFDMIFCVSALDQEVFQSRFQAKCVRLIENGVDVDYFSPADTAQQQRKAARLVFVGAMDWLPNSDGILSFISTTLPLIKESFPGVELTIVGKNPPEEIRQLNGINGVHVTGTVSDVRPYVRQADVVIVPLRFGGGTRLKILEAFASGKPVISTTLGCEGIECEHGKHLLIADTPHDFAASAIRLLSDPQLSQVLTSNARKLAVSKYSWGRICANLLSHYAQIDDVEGTPAIHWSPDAVPERL